MAPSMEVSSRGLEMAIRAASSALPLPAARPTPMWAMPAFFIMARHVGKVQIDEAGVANQVGDGLHCLTQHIVGDLKGVGKGDLLVRGVLQPLVGDDDQRVHLVLQLGNAALRLLHPAACPQSQRAW